MHECRGRMDAQERPPLRKGGDAYFVSCSAAWLCAMSSHFESMTEQPHILVVDDDRDIRTLLSEYLQKNGYRVTAVAEGKAMRRALEQTHVDLIVLDLMLPGEDGLKLCRDLRTRSQIPVLMLTALGEEIDRVLGLEVGADDYLPKPFSHASYSGVSGRFCVARRTCPAIRICRARWAIASRSGNSI